MSVYEQKKNLSLFHRRIYFLHYCSWLIICQWRLAFNSPAKCTLRQPNFDFNNYSLYRYVVYTFCNSKVSHQRRRRNDITQNLNCWTLHMTVDMTWYVYDKDHRMHITLTCTVDTLTKEIGTRKWPKWTQWLKKYKLSLRCSPTEKILSSSNTNTTVIGGFQMPSLFTFLPH